MIHVRRCARPVVASDGPKVNNEWGQFTFPSGSIYGVSRFRSSAFEHAIEVDGCADGPVPLSELKAAVEWRRSSVSPDRRCRARGFLRQLRLGRN